MRAATSEPLLRAEPSRRIRLDEKEEEDEKAKKVEEKVEKEEEEEEEEEENVDKTWEGGEV